MVDLIFPLLPDGTLNEEYIQNYARLVLASQPGLRLVPVEPNITMMACARLEANRHPPRSDVCLAAAYRAMLNAAPRVQP